MDAHQFVLVSEIIQEGTIRMIYAQRALGYPIEYHDGAPHSCGGPAMFAYWFEHSPRPAEEERLSFPTWGDLLDHVFEKKRPYVSHPFLVNQLKNVIANDPYQLLTDMDRESVCPTIET